MSTASNAEEADEPLIIEKLSDVAGVNALVPGAVIEPHEGLTILFGENATGKTGYSRIFKALAASRTADDVILGNIAAESSEPLAARCDRTNRLADSTAMSTPEDGSR